jgi:hypothetical protein
LELSRRNTRFHAEGHSEDFSLTNSCKQEKKKPGKCGQELTEKEPILQVLLQKKQVDCTKDKLIRRFDAHLMDKKWLM